MSSFTTQLRFICETAAGLSESKGYSQINSIIEDARAGIFDFSYPIFDESYRTVLEKKILKHYYTREICAETVGRWKLFLEVRMNEIMPYYNKLYSSELLQFNPLYDVDYTKSGNREKEGTEEGTESLDRTTGDRMTGTVVDDVSGTVTDALTGTTTNALTGTKADAVTGTVQDSGSNSSTRTDNLTKSSRDGGTDGESNTSANKNDRWDYYSDTPQGAVTNLANHTYLTNARHITDDGTGSTANSTKTYGKTNTTTDTGTVQNSETDSNTRTYNTNDTTTYNTTDRTTHDTQNEKEYDTETTKTYNTNKAGTLADDVERSNTINSTEEYLERVYGKTPGRTYAELLKQYRETFLNIDMMVINNLSDLFFGLYE